jgi:rhomboid family GlyGly-CTERM serine protease
LRRGQNAWAGVAALLAAGGLVLLGASTSTLELLNWRPALALSQPWRMVTAAWVHWSTGHLLANLAGAALVAALGFTLSLPLRAAAAWALAWPLTHLGLLLRPELQSYGGASGVLHAGVAVAALVLCARRADRRRWLGFAMLAGLALKVLLEQPWGPVLQLQAGWQIAIAPLAHATGAAAGLVCALAAEALARRGHNAPR